MKLIGSLLLLLIFFISCEKENKPDSPKPPVISILSIHPDTIRQFQDSVIVVLRYEDANGDIGEENPDKGVIEVKDSRLLQPDWYHVKPLAPVDNAIKIEGTLRLRLNTVFLLGNGAPEPVQFSFRMRDRFGNFSDKVTSKTLLIVQ
jgi:hypothetical protein